MTDLEEGTKLRAYGTVVFVEDWGGGVMVDPPGDGRNRRSGGRLVASVVGFWLGVGLLAGTAEFLAGPSEEAATGWLPVAAPALLMSLLWIPATLAILRASRAFPPVTLHPRLRIRATRTLLHGAGSVGIGFVLNGLFFAVLTVAEAAPPGAYWDLTASSALRFLHLNAGVYWAILALAHLPGILHSRSAALRALADRERFQETLTVRSGNQTILVRVSDIRWIEGAGDYVCLHLGLANHLHSERLKRLESRLDPDRFVRVHRSAIVNVEAVRKLRHLGHGDYEAVLEDGSTVRVSRTRRAQLAEVLGRRETRARE